MTCFKDAYKTRARAERAAKARMRAGRRLGRLRAYECPHCGGWHLTSQMVDIPTYVWPKDMRQGR